MGDVVGLVVGLVVGDVVGFPVGDVVGDVVGDPVPSPLVPCASGTTGSNGSRARKTSYVLTWKSTSDRSAGGLDAVSDSCGIGPLNVSSPGTSTTPAASATAARAAATRPQTSRVWRWEAMKRFTAHPPTR